MKYCQNNIAIDSHTIHMNQQILAIYTQIRNDKLSNAISKYIAKYITFPPDMKLIKDSDEPEQSPLQKKN